MGKIDGEEEIRKLFTRFDKQDKGFIDVYDLANIARELGDNRSDEDLQNMIDSYGSKGRVTCEQFLALLNTKPGELNIMDMYVDSSDDEEEEAGGRRQ